MPKKKKETKQIDLERHEVEKKTLEQARNPNYGKKKCACCDQFYPKDVMIGEDENGKPICDRCYSDDESEPGATVVYSGGGDDDERCTIGSYHNHTNGDFKLGYVHTDGWRGYYTVTSEVYEEVHSDCALSYSADEKMLKAFDDLLKKLCDQHNIRYARVFTRTSNVFSMGYDFFVHKKDMETYQKVAKVVDALKEAYRDPERFNLTALTGKDEFDMHDHMLVQAANRLFAGESPDDVMKDIVKLSAQLQEMQ